MNADIIKKANTIVNSSDAAYIGVIDEDGGPSVSTVSRIQSDGIFVSYFATGTDGNKTRRLLNCPKMSVCYRRDGDNVTLAGTAEILTDEHSRHEFWQDWFLDHFPEGPDDPGYCIIKFTAARASLWIEQEGAEFRLQDALTVQSRCGLLCGTCSYRESCGCGRCIETNGNPFHGECPIAVCCQLKGFSHCGECPEMPCKQLQNYSCDPEHGDHPHGARIEMLKRWAAAEKASSGQ